MSTRPTVALPHSWSIGRWPEKVHPNTVSRARQFIRKHKAALIQAGVLSRCGRELVVLGARYERWLQAQAVNVPNYTIAPNRPNQPPKAAA